MVAYYILWILLVGGIAFALFKTLQKIFSPSFIEDVPKTVEEKKDELTQLQWRLKSLGVEVKVTELLIDVDEEIAVLTRRLNEAENKRLPEEG